MVCEKCGRELKIGSKFCYYCAEPVPKEFIDYCNELEQKKIEETRKEEEERQQRILAAQKERNYRVEEIKIRKKIKKQNSKSHKMLIFSCILILAVFGLRTKVIDYFQNKDIADKTFMLNDQSYVSFDTFKYNVRTPSLYYTGDYHCEHDDTFILESEFGNLKFEFYPDKENGIRLVGDKIGICYPTETTMTYLKDEPFYGTFKGEVERNGNHGYLKINQAGWTYYFNTGENVYSYKGTYTVNDDGSVFLDIPDSPDDLLLTKKSSKKYIVSGFGSYWNDENFKKVSEEADKTVNGYE